MPHYLYLKERPKRPMRRTIVISFVFMGVGVIMLFWVLWPIFSFHFISSPILSSVTTPIASSGRNNSVFQASEVVYATQTSTQSSVDYTNANVWFPLKPQKKVANKITTYSLTIPKLRIRNALVSIGGDDLNHSIIHYGGTALPGENGNGALFGHSVLPQFFDPKNYKTIFSTLPTLETGDDILVTYDGITYRYRIQTMEVTSPDDLTMLDQQYDDSYITLVTCVPPGTYWQRLHVRAKLTKI